MDLKHRIDLLFRLGEYMLSDDQGWFEAKERASHQNGWFIPQFIDHATSNIASSWLLKDVLQTWATKYQLPEQNNDAKKVGILMAGNIPLVGFHDLLAVFICAHKAIIKPSAKDEILIDHLVEKLIEWNEQVKEYIQYESILKGCNAYIATGSNNSSRYFEYYFRKYPHIIRRNRTSVAILTGEETTEELEKLADDVHMFFGLGCRNITKIYVPGNYGFVPLLTAFKKYNYFFDHHKYKNNYDYNLAIHLLNNKYYMTNGSVLLVEDQALFSPISQLNYEYYTDPEKVFQSLKNNESLQCIVGRNRIPFGQAQNPGIETYADGRDTLQFLAAL